MSSQSKKRSADSSNESEKKAKVEESQEDKISISIDDDDLYLSPGYHLKLPSPGRTSERSKDSFRGGYSDTVDDSDGFQLSKDISSDRRKSRKYRSTKDQDIDQEEHKYRSRASDDRRSKKEKDRSTGERRRSRERDNRRSNEQQRKPLPPSSGRQRHSDQYSDDRYSNPRDDRHGIQRGDEHKRRPDVRHHPDREREDRNFRGGRGAERRPSPLPPSKRRDGPHRTINRSQSPQNRRQQRDDHSPRHHRRRTHSMEKKDVNVPSEEDELLDRLAVEVDKELDKRGIIKPMMTAVDISSSDDTSSDDVDPSEEEEEEAKVGDSHGNNTEDGELADSDEETSVSESEDEEEEEGSPRGPVIKSRLLREAISGYGEGESDQSSSPPIKGSSRQPSLTPPTVMQESATEEKSTTELPAEEGKKEEPAKDLPTIDPNLPPYYPALYGCRSVEQYEWLNRIEEGTYGVVYRARDKRTGEIVALKKLKMEKEKEGFPITSLREINTLLKSNHPNIVNVREVVFSKVDKIFIVMDYVEHDLKSLMETMKQPFLEGEVKTLLRQLLSAVAHMHENWMLHRDIKTSNLLLGHDGVLRIGDFGLAREYGSPLKPYTPVVVTLWYRAPELLLGAKEYSTAVDMWSVGCVFAELLLHKALFKGRSEIDQLNQIFKELGTPNDKIWPGYSKLPAVKKVSFKEQPFNNLRKKFPYLTQSGFDLLNRFLTYDPKKRISADVSLNHEYFKETPLPVDPSMFPTWPAKSELATLKKDKVKEKSPSAPEGGAFHQNQEDDLAGGFRLTTAVQGQAAVGQGFSLKF